MYNFAREGTVFTLMSFGFFIVFLFLGSRANRLVVEQSAYVITTVMMRNARLSFAYCFLSIVSWTCSIFSLRSALLASAGINHPLVLKLAVFLLVVSAILFLMWDGIKAVWKDWQWQWRVKSGRPR